MPEFQKAISTRLHGLGKSIEALAKEQWAGVRLMRVIEIHLSTFEAGDRLLVNGEDFMLKAEAVQNLGLVLHELATNSVKYGALSVPHGRVRISWDDVAPGDDGEPKIRLVWEESRGPLVTEPSRKGFGTTIIQRHAVAAFGGQVDVEFRPEGLVWRLTAPRANLERDDAGEERRSLAM